MLCVTTHGTTLTQMEQSARPRNRSVTRPLSASLLGWTHHPPRTDNTSDDCLRTLSFLSGLSSGEPLTPVPAQHVCEFRALRLQYRALLQNMQALELLHQRERQQHPERLQSLRELEQQVKELNQHMGQLKTFHTSFLLSQIQLQTTRRPGAAALSKNIRLRSNMMLLQQQVDFSIRVITQQMQLTLCPTLSPSAVFPKHGVLSMNRMVHSNIPPVPLFGSRETLQ